LYPNDAKLIFTLREWHPEKMRTEVPPHQTGRFQGPPADPKDWADFCRRIARVLGDRITAYQLGNEPNNIREVSEDGKDTLRQWLGTPEEWAENIIIGANAIREVDPDAFIIAGGTGIGKSFQDPWYMRGVDSVVNYVDCLDLHYYGNPWSNDSAWHNVILKNITEYCNNHGVRFSVTELGTPNASIPDGFWNEFDSLRLVENLSYHDIAEVLYNKIRAVDRESLILPNNMELAHNLGYEYTKSIVTDFLNYGAYFVGWYCFAQDIPDWWYGDKRASLYYIGQNRQIFRTRLTSKQRYWYNITADGDTLGNPVRFAFKELADELKSGKIGYKPRESGKLQGKAGN
ncbi:MAG: cellulase family glycosylhydrolase, partial [candidate division Zixibacteria bacterium]|nr:cellulase family glycosylhydrolase [candidate division Zixibacteria bacterium]